MKKTIYLFLSCLLTACSSHPAVPTECVEVNELPVIYPDYTETTVPANIAPLNFMVKGEDVRCVACFDFPGGTETYGNGNKVQIPEQVWHDILSACRGKSMQVTLYTKTDGNDKWQRHPAFNIHVAEEEIDPWLSYRLIEPSYVAYENLDIMQRDLTSFREEIIASNHAGKKKAQCINCHSYQNYHTGNMLFHVRGDGGGTMLVRNNQPQLMTAMRREGMISNPVYPAWHPTLPLIAFSANKTGQLFHTQSTAKIEVQDTESHLLFYDVERDSMIVIQSPVDELETFPTWSADGRHIYYCSAHYEQQDTTLRIDRDVANHYEQVKYNLYVRDVDTDSLKVGERRLLLNLANQNQSATLPRVSPDGKSLLFASGHFGCFHIWHHDADIHLLNLETMQVDSLTALNSQRAESYPSWSSNGRWIIMASRRDDGNYSRVYMAYYDAQGHAHKAFALPQADPEHDLLLLRSYNRPETMVEQVSHRLY